MRMPTYRTAFISHAHADNYRCNRIATLLRQSGHDLWIDINNLQMGDVLPTTITQELRQRQAFVLMVTPTSDASPWVGLELDNYLAYSLDPGMALVDGQSRLILPVLLEATTIGSAQKVSNLAKVFGRNRIDGVGKDDQQVANEIASALAIAQTIDTRSTASIGAERSGLHLPGRNTITGKVISVQPGTRSTPDNGLGRLISIVIFFIIAVGILAFAANLATEANAGNVGGLVASLAILISLFGIRILTWLWRVPRFRSNPVTQTTEIRISTTQGVRTVILYAYEGRGGAPSVGDWVSFVGRRVGGELTTARIRVWVFNPHSAQYEQPRPRIVYVGRTFMPWWSPFIVVGVGVVLTFLILSHYPL